MSTNNMAYITALRASRHYAIFSDGSCPGNPGPGGWGVVLQLHDGERVIRQAVYAGYQRPETTNIRMEMTAVLKGLSKLHREPETTAIVVTDNKMIVEAMTTGSFIKWKAAGWMRGRKPVKNGDLWEAIDTAIGERTVAWQWVRGHAGHPENEIANTLATNAADGRYLKQGATVRAAHNNLFF